MNSIGGAPDCRLAVGERQLGGGDPGAQQADPGRVLLQGRGEMSARPVPPRAQLL